MYFNMYKCWDLTAQKTYWNIKMLPPGPGLTVGVTSTDCDSPVLIQTGCTDDSGGASGIAVGDVIFQNGEHDLANFPQMYNLF